jgi:tripartite-type tricarboxylate transporter receptor subunit TctC
MSSVLAGANRPIQFSAITVDMPASADVGTSGSARLRRVAKTESARNLQQTMDLARIVLGFPAGGSVDAVGRRIADKMHPGYARSVIVENRVGGGGPVATIAMKTAPSDGSTMLMTPMSILGVYPHTYRKLPYDPLADLRPVSRAVSYNFGFAIGPAVPDSIKTIPQFMEWCKATPAKASFGSAATGSTLHFTGILLGRTAGVEMTYVGYRGSSAVLTDVAGGVLPACVLPIGPGWRLAVALRAGERIRA